MKQQTKRRIKITVAVILSVIVLGFLAVHLTIMHYVSQFSPSIKTTTKTLVHVKIRDNEFWIPANYFESPYSVQDKREHTALLEVHWPDMTGATKETIAYYKTHFGHGKKIIILLSPTGPAQIDESYTKQFNSTIGKDKLSFISYDECNTKKYGLYYCLASSSNPNRNFDDVYIDSKTKPFILIRCTGVKVPKKRIPSPGCQMRYTEDGIAMAGYL